GAEHVLHRPDGWSQLFSAKAAHVLFRPAFNTNLLGPTTAALLEFSMQKSATVPQLPSAPGRIDFAMIQNHHTYPLLSASLPPPLPGGGRGPQVQLTLEKTTQQRRIYGP
ncbi:unnamed protein product, partial [Ectocarpus sp. 4 AP-2014]